MPVAKEVIGVEHNQLIKIETDKARIKMYIVDIERVQCRELQSSEVIAALIRFLTALDDIVTNLESDIKEIEI